jgi:hypothetical protein
METQSEKDRMLWKIAKKRAAFKSQAISYVAVNLFLIGIWYFTLGKKNMSAHFWPIWPILGWGLGLFFSYLGAYGKWDFISAEKEYEQLKKQQ